MMIVGTDYNIVLGTVLNLIIPFLKVNTDIVAMRILIRGTVQGVGFRPMVYRSALKVGASGSVWNNGSDVIIDTDKG